MAGLELDQSSAQALGLVLDEARLAPLPAWAVEQEDAGALDFLKLPLDLGPARAVKIWAAGVPAFDDVIVAGIGGSALAARVFDALRPEPGRGPRLHVLDTVDPVPTEALLATVDPARTILIGISKSGTTLETGALFGVFEHWMRGALGAEAAARIVVVCGEESNPLRSHAESEGYVTFDVPSGVGGRYSALTAVGLLPAALVGVDPVALLAGAAEAREASLSGDLNENHALALAALHVAAEEAGRHATVLFPYGECLAPLGPWWAQLVGESLGKPGAAGPLGVTPVAARGPADQHSLLQLLVEGPDDKLTLFVDAGAAEPGPVVPAGWSDAAGHALGEIMAAEREATTYALEKARRPWVRIRLDAADPQSVGAFLLTYEMVVVYWGRLIGVDPFGQPGVTLGKQAALARLRGEPAEMAADVARFGDS